MIKGLSFCIRSSGARERFLERAIRSIHLQDIDVPYEVIVYGSTDLDQSKLHFKLIEGKDDALNARYGKMLNILAESASYEILVYLDDDSELMPYWWHNTSKLNPDEFDLTCFKMYQLQKEYWELAPWYDWAEVVPGKSIMKDWGEPANGRTYIGAGGLIVKRKVVLDVKFDEEEGGGEDSRFCFRCFQKGYKLKTFPFMKNAVCIHFLCKEGRHEFKK